MKFILCLLLAVCLTQVNCGIYSLYKNNRNVFHDLTRKDKMQRDHMVGEIKRIDVNDKHVADLLSQHLGRLITGDESQIVVGRLDEVSRQTVAGISYRARGHFIIGGVEKHCTVSILERAWHQTEKVIISAKCDDGSCYVTETYTCPPKVTVF